MQRFCHGKAASILLDAATKTNCKQPENEPVIEPISDSVFRSWQLIGPGFITAGKKTLRIMKIAAILILAACLQVSAKGYSQKVTLSVKNASLTDVLENIQKQTGCSFVYKPEIIQKANRVDLEVKDVALDQALTLIFSNQPLSFTMFGNNIITIKNKRETYEEIGLFIATDISGIVTDENNVPLEGTSVIIKRTGLGTLTNSKGNFFLKGLLSDDIILVSHIGYETNSIKIAGESTLNVKLKIAINELDRAVVQAYGNTTQRLATGSIVKVTSEEIARHPLMNPIQILQGLVPGALVTNADGSSSSTIKIEIRGRNAIDPNIISEPLYIIDGVPMTTLNLTSNVVQAYVAGSNTSQGAIQTGIVSNGSTGQSQFFGINPNDIESIEILKDADATAIYGSRAANGVILLTTKKGKFGKTHSEINVFSGYSQVTRQYHLLNTQQYIQMRKEALTNDGLPIDNQTAPDLAVWDTTRYTDWQKYVYGGIGRRTSMQVSMTGGDARTTFRAGVGYDYAKDIITEKGGNYRGAFSLNLNHRSLNQKLTISWSNLFSVSKIDVVNKSASVLTPPNAPAIYDDRGNLNYAGWDPISDYYPFGGLRETYISKTNFLNSNLILKYEILKGLSISSSFGYNNSQNDQTRKFPIASQNPANNPKGIYQLGRTNFHNLIIEPKFEYSNFINKGNLSVLIGATFQDNVTDGLVNYGTNYANDLLLNSINTAPTKSVTNYYGEYKYSGVFGRINYNWENKYILNLNARRDGSSRFGPGRQFGNFGSVGAAWIFTEEKWMQNLSFLSFGKIRGSYGITGSDQIIDYQYLSRWQFGNGFGATGTYNSNVPLSPAGFYDSLLQWEVNKKLEASIYIGFLKDRISLEVSWYRNRCNNQLVQFPTPIFSGFTSVTSNTPANVENTGWEFILNWRIFENKNFKWTTRTTFSINRNKLVAYPNFSTSPYQSRLAIGKPLNIVKLLQFTGIDSQTGTYTFADLDKSGAINLNFVNGIDDRYPVILAPKFDGGFSTNFSYDNWELSSFFYFRKQLGYNILATSNVAGTIQNQPTEVLNRWQKQDDISKAGKFTTSNTTNTDRYFSFSDAIVTDASFIRLQNLSLAYVFPENLRKKAGLTNFKIYVQGENLFVVTNYKGIDPEVQVLTAMPRPRILTFGLTCNF